MLENMAVWDGKDEYHGAKNEVLNSGNAMIAPTELGLFTIISNVISACQIWRRSGGIHEVCEEAETYDTEKC